MTLINASQAVHAETGIDHWFLAKLRSIVRMEQRAGREATRRRSLLLPAKRMGFSDQQIDELARHSSGRRFRPARK